MNKELVYRLFNQYALITPFNQAHPLLQVIGSQNLLHTAEQTKKAIFRKPQFFSWTLGNGHFILTTAPQGRILPKIASL